MSTEGTAEQAAAEYIPEKVKKAEKKLEENPYDLDAWSILIREAQNQPIDKARKTHERLVSQFPSSGRFWKLFIEAEIKAKNYDKVEKLFQRCLMKVLHIDLWKCYLAYVRETKGKLPSYKEKMAQAYDFALDKIGMEIMSYQIWVDYINFLKGVEAVGSYAENQRITAVRRVYQRGCVNPMINIEQLWRDYSKYEEASDTITSLRSGINVHLAKKMIEDRSRDYMNARRVAKEYETVMKGLDRNAPSVPPQNSPQEAQQVEMWKKYIQWEKSNPLRTEDQTLITKRVMFAYEQCLLVLGHHPDIWYEAAQYLEQSSKLLAEKGSRMKYEKVHSIYNKLLAIEDIDPTLVYTQYMKFARRAEGIKSGRAIFKKAREDLRTRHHVYVEIWARFLAFESNIGDLASILKVERRRVVQPRKTLRSRVVTFVACLKDVSRAKLAALLPEAVVAPSVPALKDDPDRKPEYPKPDTNQMIPYQPRHLARVDAAVELITGRQPEAAGEGNGSMENHATAKSLKRPNADSDEEDDKGAVAPPIHDIYRARQQKRIR
ncbi:Cleavage stimulation factor subunit 3 [Goodea atripinnis]|uniref:Cleavage stimulation factor subunit 3 n=1 Tax=Goodea atripinnis TaxID=208336 RepID=A0ABV0N6V3_9TELE